MPVKIQGDGSGFAGIQPFCGIKLHWAPEVGAVTGASLHVVGTGAVFLCHLDLVSSLWAVGRVSFPPTSNVI